jgi:glycosyltransferase involved in cell wall biosynthesis
VDDEALRLAMGEAGRRKALEDYTFDRMLAETEKVYEALGLKSQGRTYSRRNQ